MVSTELSAKENAQKESSLEPAVCSGPHQSISAPNGRYLQTSASALLPMGCGFGRLFPCEHTHQSESSVLLRAPDGSSAFRNWQSEAVDSFINGILLGFSIVPPQVYPKSTHNMHPLLGH